MRKIISILIIMLLISLFVGVANVYAADDLSDIKSGMQNVYILDAGNGGIKGAINTVIGLLQVAGTGIALVVITMLGIKYLIASPSEKADTKKQIMPILIGCILLFGAVNITAAIAELAKATE